MGSTGYRSSWTALLASLLVTSCAEVPTRALDTRAILEATRTATLAEPADGLGPEDAVALALTQNPELRAFRRERDVAEGQVVSARAWQNPELRLDLQDPLRFALGLRFFPPRPGERPAHIAQAEARQRRIAAEIEDRENHVAAATRIAHARVRLLDREVALADAALAIHDQVLARVEGRLQTSQATEIDETVAVLGRLEVEERRAALARQRDDARAALASDLGAPEVTGLRLRGPRSLTTPDPLSPEVEDQVVTQRPDVRALAEAYAEREQSVRLAHIGKRLWPTFLQPGMKKIPDKPTADLSASMELPLFDDAGPLREAEARRDEARDDFTARVAVARAELRGARARLAEVEARRRTFEVTIAPALTRAETLAQERLAAGDGDLRTLASIEDTVLLAREHAAEADFERERALVELALASGAVLGPPAAGAGATAAGPASTTAPKATP